MNRFKFRNRHEVKDMIDNKGLEYLITRYCRSDAMPDDELRNAFDRLENEIDLFNDLLPDDEGQA